MRLKSLSKIFALLLLGGLSDVILAGENDISLPAGFQQSSLDSLVTELGLITSYNPQAPAETLGVLGFEAGVSISGYEIDQVLWNSVVSDSDAPSTLFMPRLMLRKGLPWGVDVGYSYVSLPSSSIKISAAEVRKSLLDGSVVSPAVSVLLHGSRLSGVSDLKLSTLGADIAISKGFAMLTPYAGVGVLRIKGSDESGLGLSDVSATENRTYVGVKVGFFPFLNLVAQADFAELNSYALRLNVSF